MIPMTSDMKDLIILFNEFDVEYMVCGGYAVGYYGFIRATYDFDILINPNKKNALKAMNALIRFGFGDAGFDEKVFESEGTAIHLGAEPNAIDLLTSVSTKKSSFYFENTLIDTIDGVTMKYIALDDLIEVKKMANRSKDKIDVEELLLIKQRR